MHYKGVGIAGIALLGFGVEDGVAGAARHDLYVGDGPDGVEQETGENDGDISLDAVIINQPDIVLFVYDFLALAGDLYRLLTYFHPHILTDFESFDVLVVAAQVDDQEVAEGQPFIP